MTLPLPSAFHPELTEERLQTIATRIMEVRHDTLRELNSDLDDNYVRETAIFGRTRQMLIGMALSTQFPWMNLSHPGLDVTARIGDIPFRFFRDDPDSPEKHGFFKRNAVDDLFEIDDSAPVMWRFILERAATEDAEDRVHFVGYNAYQQKVSEWTLSPSATRQLTSVDQNVPLAKPLPMPEVQLLPDDEDGAEVAR